MKPSRIAAEKERLARVRLRRWARRIPGNAELANILAGFPEKPFRSQFYYRILPHLRFVPLKLEELEPHV